MPKTNAYEYMNNLSSQWASLKVSPSCWENRPKWAPATFLGGPSPRGMSWNCLPDLWSFFGDGPGTDLKMFPPGTLSIWGTPAEQMTHFQFNAHQINLFLTYRKGLNTGLTPGQMPLASKQPRIDLQSQCHWSGRKQSTPKGTYTFRIVHALMWI
jgi:hypothetical protein